MNTKMCSKTFLLTPHKWGIWKDKQTGIYHSVCCERCGLWWGDFVRKHPNAESELTATDTHDKSL